MASPGASLTGSLGAGQTVEIDCSGIEAVNRTHRVSLENLAHNVLAGRLEMVGVDRPGIVGFGRSQNAVLNLDVPIVFDFVADMLGAVFVP